LSEIEAKVEEVLVAKTETPVEEVKSEAKVETKSQPEVKKEGPEKWVKECVSVLPADSIINIANNVDRNFSYGE